MFAEKRRQAACLISGDAFAARGSLSHDCRNCRTLRETKFAACEEPCPETGVERRQIITGFSMAMIGDTSAMRSQRSQSSIPGRFSSISPTAFRHERRKTALPQGIKFRSSKLQNTSPCGHSRG